MSAREFKVIDKDGEWVVNTSPYRLAFTRNEVEALALESGIPTKVVLDEFLKGQETIKPCADPVNSDEPIPTVTVHTENTLVPTDGNGEADASKAPGVLGTKAETTVTGDKPTGHKRR